MSLAGFQFYSYGHIFLCYWGMKHIFPMIKRNFCSVKKRIWWDFFLTNNCEKNLLITRSTVLTRSRSCLRQDVNLCGQKPTDFQAHLPARTTVLRWKEWLFWKYPYGILYIEWTISHSMLEATYFFICNSFNGCSFHCFLIFVTYYTILYYTIYI